MDQSVKPALGLQRQECTCEYEEEEAGERGAQDEALVLQPRC